MAFGGIQFLGEYLLDGHVSLGADIDGGEADGGDPAAQQLAFDPILAFDILVLHDQHLPVKRAAALEMGKTTNDG